ncbi:ABC transporter substrate-binding protein [Halobacterium sp. KA-6]|jgi:branched-chain amino acid transport system substrate-binding protein|uniref:ABC transporter substrate-binding protein n=1 Tax=Halobacterium sp. KA-6 TaxID=2896368 RepID=UPI001E45F200|nr:ABC transporter substrate-binding protein [Halobacterium sp. KA-6]MCD2203382.1 ABC transporter substrate-binding protein [Halobacterium sp. KA-6]
MAEYNRRSFLAKSGAVTGIAVSLAGCMGGGGGGNQIQLGAINPLSGSAAAFGELATEAQSAWVENVNSDGGLDVGGESREVSIVEYDDESSNDQARSAAQRLATSDDVSMILSSWRSNGAIAINEVINNNQIPTFTHGFTPQVNTEGTYMMRLTVSTVMDAYPALQFVSDSDDIDRIGVIAEEGDWGGDTLDLMDWWFNEAGNDGEYENLGRFSFSQQDFSSYITSARNADIDALYVQTWAAAMQRFIAQQDRAGLNDEMPILTGLGGADYNSLDQVGGSMTNVYALGVYTRLSYADNDQIAETISDEALSQFEAYQSIEGTPDHPTAYNVYADAQAAEYALTQAGSTNGQDLREALVGNEFTTILGDATINNRGQPSIPGALIKFDGSSGEAEIDTVAWDGQLPPITSIPPETEL